jgi:hypothetical protein
MPSAITLTLRQARLAWLARQSLLPTPSAASPTPAAVTASIGWIPVVSGASPYLSLLARGALARRADLDAAVFTHSELALVPGPRGLLWLVPTADAPLARAFAMADHTSREARVASACGLTARDLEATRDALRAALDSPRTPPQLRAMLSPDALRSLGTPGRRAGLATLAGLVLRALWIQGEVTRAPLDARLDRERFRYALAPHPRAVPSAAEAVDAFAPRWLAAHAPASARDFALAFDIAASRAAAALKPLRAVDVRVEGLDGALLAPADFTAPDARDDAPSAHLLPVHDALAEGRAGLAGIAAPEVTRALELRAHGYGPIALVDGEAVGAWSWDGARVTLRPLVALPEGARQRLDGEASRVTAFLSGEGVEAALHDGKQPRSGPMLPGELLGEL